MTGFLIQQMIIFFLGYHEVGSSIRKKDSKYIMADKLYTVNSVDGAVKFCLVPLFAFSIGEHVRRIEARSWKYVSE